MADHQSILQTCRQCGAQFVGSDQAGNDLCESCAPPEQVERGLGFGSELARRIGEAPDSGGQDGSSPGEIASAESYHQQPDYASEPATAGGNYYADQRVIEEGPPDPDSPHWSPQAGIGMWVLSVMALLIVPLVAVLAWYGIEVIRGAAPPATQEGLNAWVLSPTVILVQVLSTVIAHIITLGFCWVLVTRMGRRPFLDSLGWKWEGRSAASKTLFVFGVVATMFAVFIALDRVLPQTKETQFDLLLKTSQQVRYAIAFMAVFTAPFVEEVVYRGVLFSALRKRIGVSSAIAFVTLLFSAVHVLQYWGAWAGMIGLTILSFALTLIRTRTGSILPCVAVHLVFNGVQALVIVFSRPS